MKHAIALFAAAAVASPFHGGPSPMKDERPKMPWYEEKLAQDCNQSNYGTREPCMGSKKFCEDDLQRPAYYSTADACKQDRQDPSTITKRTSPPTLREQLDKILGPEATKVMERLPTEMMRSSGYDIPYVEMTMTDVKCVADFFKDDRTHTADSVLEERLRKELVACLSEARKNAFKPKETKPKEEKKKA